MFKAGGLYKHACCLDACLRVSLKPPYKYQDGRLKLRVRWETNSGLELSDWKTAVIKPKDFKFWREVK